MYDDHDHMVDAFSYAMRAKAHDEWLRSRPLYYRIWLKLKKWFKSLLK